MNHRFDEEGKAYLFAGSIPPNKTNVGHSNAVFSAKHNFKYMYLYLIIKIYFSGYFKIGALSHCLNRGSLWIRPISITDEDAHCNAHREHISGILSN